VSFGLSRCTFILLPTRIANVHGLFFLRFFAFRPPPVYPPFPEPFPSLSPSEGCTPLSVFVNDLALFRLWRDEPAPERTISPRESPPSLFGCNRRSCNFFSPRFTLCFSSLLSRASGPPFRGFRKNLLVSSHPFGVVLHSRLPPLPSLLS